MWINTGINNKEIVFYCSFFITLLYSINAGAMNRSSAWVRLALVYYKNLPYHEKNGHKVSGNEYVPGCVLRTDSAKPHHTLWHCQEKIYLLRPLSEVASWHKEQGQLKLKFSAFTINHIRAKITSFHILKNAPDLSAGDQMPVTGIFITHAPGVGKYSFRHIGTGHISTIRVTPDHPFYLRNTDSFLPVARLSPASNLLNNRNEIIRIICPAGSTTHCGTSRYTSLPVQVYNLEIYKKHTFYAGSDRILVHNCTSPVHVYTDVTTPSDAVKYVACEKVEEAGGVLHLTRDKLSISSARATLTSAEKSADHTEKTVFYNLKEARYNFDSGSLMIEFNHSAGQSPEQLGKIMSTSQDFEKASMISIINDGLGENPDDHQCRLFAQYFKELANQTNKNVVYNLKGDINTSTGNKYAKSMVLGMYDSASNKFFVNNLRQTHYMSVRPEKRYSRLN